MLLIQKIFFVKRSQYISIKNPLHKQSLKWGCGSKRDVLELTTLRIKSWNKDILIYPKSVRIKDLNTQKDNFEDFETISTLSGAVFDMMSFWWCCLTTNFQVQQDSHLRANRLSYFSMFQLMLAAVLASIQSPYHAKCSERKEKVLQHFHNLTIPRPDCISKTLLII